jgi:F-type H+-transporting ATPase subunit gamma
MKMVAASKFRRAQLTLEKSELFQNMMMENLKKVLADVEMQEAELGVKFVRPKLMIQPKDPKTYALFVLASDKGLCGSYNTMVAKEAKRRIDELKKDGFNAVFDDNANTEASFIVFDQSMLTQTSSKEMKDKRR